MQRSFSASTLDPRPSLNNPRTDIFPRTNYSVKPMYRMVFFELYEMLRIATLLSGWQV